MEGFARPSGDILETEYFVGVRVGMGESEACVMPVTFPEISTHLKFAWNVLGDRGAPLHQFGRPRLPQRTRRPANERDEAARELAGGDGPTGASESSSSSTSSSDSSYFFAVFWRFGREAAAPWWGARSGAPAGARRPAPPPPDAQTL